MFLSSLLFVFVFAVQQIGSKHCFFLFFAFLPKMAWPTGQPLCDGPWEEDAYPEWAFGGYAAEAAVKADIDYADTREKLKHEKAATTEFF